MDVDRLRQDLKEVRERGIPRTSLESVPVLKEALARWRPDRDDASLHHALEGFLAKGAALLDEHDERGIHLALGIGGEARNPADRRQRSSADRREAFAAHYMASAETVRRSGHLEDQILAKLAAAILSLPEIAAAAPTPAEASPAIPSTAPGPGALTASSGGQTITSRSRAYYAIDSFERDLRHLIETRLLDHLPPDVVFGAEFDRLSARRVLDDASETDPLTRYLHPEEAYDALLRNADALPAELSHAFRQNLSAFDGFIAPRNRLMRGRPLKPDDLERTEVLLSRFPQGHFPQTKLSLSQLASDNSWQPRPRPGARPPERILHNLPAPDFDETGLLGRDEQVETIVGLLKRRREPITLRGEGGIGKTALALEVCYRLADDPDPPFDAILWVSLKSERLTPAGVQQLSNAIRDLEGAVGELGRAVDQGFRGSARDLARALGSMPALIVIDNLETASGSEFIALYDTLPDTVTFLLTSRVGLGAIDRPVRVGPLEDEIAVSLFRSFARDRGQSELADKSPAAAEGIVAQLRHSPLAIRWYVLSVESGRTPTDTLRNQEALLNFCVQNVVDDLGSGEEHLLEVLLALDRPVLLEELAVISDMGIDTLRRAAQRLLRSSLLVTSTQPDPHEPDSGSDLLELSSTARAFLCGAVEPATAQNILQRDASYNQEREQERERIADHGRYLDPNVIFERTEADAPTAHLLKRALRENRSGHPDDASATLAKARTLDPGFFEVDRVDAILAGYRRATETATTLFHSARRNCDTDDERAWVGYFFANHLARQVHDLRGAISLSEDSHRIFDSYDTALQLGNLYVWDARFEEGRPLIELALERAPRKPRFERIATTALVECWRRWSEDSVASDPTAALLRAIRGATEGLRLHESGSTDEPLMGSIVLAAAAGVRAAGNGADIGADAAESLANNIRRISTDPRFAMVPEWRHLEDSLVALNADERSRLAPGLGATSPGGTPPASDRLHGSVISLHDRYGFIAHSDFPENVFFHRGSLRLPTSWDDLDIGRVVEFTPSKNHKGQDQALEIGLPQQDGPSPSTKAE